MEDWDYRDEPLHYQDPSGAGDGQRYLDSKIAEFLRDGWKVVSINGHERVLGKFGAWTWDVRLKRQKK